MGESLSFSQNQTVQFNKSVDLLINLILNLLFIKLGYQSATLTLEMTPVIFSEIAGNITVLLVYRAILYFNVIIFKFFSSFFQLCVSYL